MEISLIVIKIKSGRLTSGLHCSASAKSASTLCSRLNRSGPTVATLLRNDDLFLFLFCFVFCRGYGGARYTRFMGVMGFFHIAPIAPISRSLSE